MIFSIAITGPTASGKTGLSLALAKRLSGEIISADSMQIYKRMDIGTAKATEEERDAVPHHLLDFVSPLENYSVECYRAAALSLAEEITSRGRLPMLVGGTGLYVSSLLRADQADTPGSDAEYREKILASLKTVEDIDALWQRLHSVDPDSAEVIHKNNVKRVIRALEIYDKTGITKTELDRRSREGRAEIFVGMITLDFHNRDTLYSRIDQRVDIMVEDGLFDEVKALYDEGLLREGTTAAQAIGYKEIIEYLRGRCTPEEAIAEIKLASRRYAKRQLTWFRHTEGAYTLYMDDEAGNMRPTEEVIAEAEEAYEGFLCKYKVALR